MCGDRCRACVRRGEEHVCGEVWSICVERCRACVRRGEEHV